jgi:zinc finger HIT domain-containing protein 1
VLKKKGGAKVGGKRKTRGAVQAKRVPRSFAGLLDEAMLDRVPGEISTYLSAAAGPATTGTARKFCSVCGFEAGLYSCCIQLYKFANPVGPIA